MDLRQIESFYWIATLGSFSAAAKRLFITQSAISTRILSFERDLGGALFDRAGRKLTLTDRGLELFDKAEELLGLMAEMRQSATGRSRIRGTVRLGVVNTIAHTWLPQVVREMDERYPEVNIDVQVGVSAMLQNALNNHDVDLAITFGRMSGPALKSDFLCRYPVEWIASPAFRFAKSPTPLAELARHRIMTYERGAVLHRFVTELFRKQGLWPIRLSGSNSVAAMVELALAGVAICVIPSPVVATHLTTGRLRVLKTAARLPDVDFFVSRPTQPFNELAALVADVALGVCRPMAVRSSTRARTSGSGARPRPGRSWAGRASPSSPR